MSAKSYTLQREVELHNLNIKLLRQRSLADALEYALDAKEHYQSRDGEVAALFLGEAVAISREMHPDAFKPEPAIPAAMVRAEKSELLVAWAV